MAVKYYAKDFKFQSRHLKYSSWERLQSKGQTYDFLSSSIKGPHYEIRIKETLSLEWIKAN